MGVIVVRRTPSAQDSHLQQSPTQTWCGLPLTPTARRATWGYVSCTQCVILLRQAQHHYPFDDPLVPYDDEAKT